ncbi:MAG: DUF1501 domain-containing protein [Saprospiraceae bacterium]|nr:DUF1501 domain-containing protein [Saprospiraceae bacterium]
MKRRKFLKAVAPVAIMPSLIDKLSFKAFPSPDILRGLTNSEIPNDHVLVMIFLNGGNDGLNTVVPLDQMSNLANARGNILLPEGQLHKIVDKQIGLHPALGGFKTLYDEDKLQIVQSVGYPQPNFSHFRSTDIWASGSDADQYLDSGWIGRFLETNFPGYPNGYPNPDNPDPLAIQLGSNMPLLFQGDSAQMAFNVSSPDIFNVNVDPTSDPAPNTPAGEELTYIRTITGQINDYAEQIVSAYIQGSNAYSGYPAEGTNYLADELKAVARLIKGGLKTRIYMVSLYGFDTHAEQVVAGNTGTGVHATLLKFLNDAVFSFQRDLEQLGEADRVLGMTFSEFGRRVISNGSVGTDHGAAAPLFLFGNKVQPGVLGNNPVIPSGANVDDNLPMQYDFRSVYASVLSKWFCMDAMTTDDILLQPFQDLPVIKDTCSVSFDPLDPTGGELKVDVYPNPMVDRVQVQVVSPGGYSRLEFFDPLGRVVQTRNLGTVARGTYTYDLYNEGYSPGSYYVRVQCGSHQQVKLIQIVR